MTVSNAATSLLIAPNPFSLPIIIGSFGVKTGLPFPKAECYIDCRGLPDPSLTNHLNGTGDDPELQKWVKEQLGGGLMDYVGIVNQGISRLPSRRQGDNPYLKPFRILCMCAHGVHRSRAMKHLLADYFTKQGYTVEIQ